MESKKIKVAILGGGAGAMAAAFALSGSPELRARYDVTVHQLGFRLGGKGASGRNPKESGRLEELGHHVWMGFYDSAFRMMRACYEELGRAPDAKLATFEQAFVKQNEATILCKLTGDSPANGGWFPWAMRFATNDLSPGTSDALPSPWTLFQLGIEQLWGLWSRSEDVATLRERLSVASRSVHADAGGGGVDRSYPKWIVDALAEIEAIESFAPIDHFLVGSVVPKHDAPDVSAEPGSLGQLVSAIRNVVRSLPQSPREHASRSHQLLLWLLRELLHRAKGPLAPLMPNEAWAYRLWVSIHLAGAIALGFLSDGLLFHGHGAIDHLDFREWLEKHGADETTLGSGPVRAIYDALFAYVNGDPEKGNLASGTCLWGLFRALLTYRGAVFWHLAAGMGDTVFAPLYEVLKRRGVKFQFFRRVTGLKLSPDKASIGAIEMVQQVKLKSGAYEPLIDVDGLVCWPSAPLYDQIVDGDELALSEVDLESPYSEPWKDARPLTLIAGLDFDKVILGISLGAIPFICPELIVANKAFGSMVANVGTTQTLSFRLWLNKDLPDLGWEASSGSQERPLATAYVAPTSGWADLTHLLSQERWGGESIPVSVSSFCGPLEQLGPNPPFTERSFLARQTARVGSIARKFLENDVGRIWPLATKSEGHGFRWDFVVSQHHRAGVDPSDRQVLSAAGSIRYRLAPDGTGITNLALAGDWVRTSVNLGCVEAAVEGGMLAAATISGGMRPSGD